MKLNVLYRSLLGQIEKKDARIDGLKQLVSSLVSKIDSLENELDGYKALVREQRDTINLLNRKLYGTKSEKTHPDGQKGENEENAPSSHKTVKDKTNTDGKTDNGGTPGNDGKTESTRQKKPRKPYKRPERRAYDDVEEKIEILMPDAEELKGAKFVRSEKTCRLYMIPAKIVKVIYDRRIYAKGGKLLVPRLPYVPENFQKRHIEPSLIAGLLTNKFCYHIPIHRQTAMFKNAGANIARSTLYDWCGEGIDALEGLYQTIRDEVLKADYLNVDETTVSVIDENVHHTKKEYMWGLVDTKNRLAFFDYDQGSRSKGVIDDILQDYIGTIQSDGYSAYRNIGTEDNRNRIRRLSCLAHIRRKFRESRENDAEHSDQALSIINGIYRLEKCFRRLKLIPDKIKEYRIRFIIPLFRKFKQWLDTNIANPKILGESLIGKAISYAYKEFDALKYIFDNGEFRVDNNAAERLLRPAKLGLNNYLFFGNHKNAKRGAIIYTIVESCKLNGVNVFEYLKEVFSKEPQVGETYEEMLPNKML